MLCVLSSLKRFSRLSICLIRRIACYYYRSEPGYFFCMDSKNCNVFDMDQVKSLIEENAIFFHRFL